LFWDQALRWRGCSIAFTAHRLIAIGRISSRWIFG
jgi:hypothetical protein